MSALCWNFDVKRLCLDASDHNRSLTICSSAFDELSKCEMIFNWASSI